MTEGKKTYAVTVEAVFLQEPLQLAINAAYEKPNAADLVVPRKGAIPTPEEFIKYTAGVVNTQV